VGKLGARCLWDYLLGISILRLTVYIELRASTLGLCLGLPICGKFASEF
jgi:hypothetical protein